jgi:hypothetical protein
MKPLEFGRLLLILGKISGSIRLLANNWLKVLA